MEGEVPAVLIYEDLGHLTPYMHTAEDVVGTSLNSPELLEGSARLAAAAILELAGGLVPSGPAFVRGDTNLDGVIDISDPVRTLIILFVGPLEGLSCPSSADADDSGSLDLTDALYTLNYLYLAGPSPPPPFPACGPDPTMDTLGCPSPPPCS